ncbi:MAG TPA: MOSC domain-containing protein [Candidatus Limnocylindrales bacterium]|nr:MOSC domain-containing protein [Candidatus Limnocylindrales bacterium]
MRGRVVSVNVSPGGVPKRPIERAWVGTLGLDADGHDSPNHGGAIAAVCLYSVEAIARVAADGHEAFPGAFGENVTVEGIDWASLGPGDRLVLGDDGLELELTQTAAPCAKQARWFVGGAIERISVKRYPADARWYARVLAEGPVAVGDEVEVSRAAVSEALPAGGQP